MSSEALRLATLGDERIIRLEQDQRALVDAFLFDPDEVRTSEREANFVATVKRLRDHGWGRPVAAPALRTTVRCDWAPAPSIDPADVPTIPESLQREVDR